MISTKIIELTLSWWYRYVSPMDFVRLLRVWQETFATQSQKDVAKILYWYWPVRIQINARQWIYSCVRKMKGKKQRITLVFELEAGEKLWLNMYMQCRTIQTIHCIWQADTAYHMLYRWRNHSKQRADDAVLLKKAKLKFKDFELTLMSG